MSFRPLAGISGLRTMQDVVNEVDLYFGFRPLAGISGLRTNLADHEGRLLV